MTKKKSKKSSKAEDLRTRAKRVVEHVELTDVRLLGARVSQNLRGATLPAFSAQQVQVGVKHNKKNNELIAYVDFGISIGYEEEHVYDDTVESPILIESRFGLTYAIASQELEPDDLNAFAEATATFNSWPYWREFVQSMTTRMGLPNLTIPLFRIEHFAEAEQRSSRRSPRSQKTQKPTKRRRK